MNPSTIGAIGVLVLFVMLFFRIPVWVALTLVGFVGNSIMSGVMPTFALAGTVPFDVGSSYNLSVLPLFILMGEVASETGLSSDLFKAARVALAGVRGGLAVGALAASACFGAVCGSSLATAATMTRIALPDMRKAGYDVGLASGALAAKLCRRNANSADTSRLPRASAGAAAHTIRHTPTPSWPYTTKPLRTRLTDAPRVIMRSEYQPPATELADRKTNLRHWRRSWLRR